MHPILSSLLGGCIVTALTATAGLPFAEWTFETSVPAANNSQTIGPIAAETGPASAVASGFHSSSATDWTNPTGNGSAESWSVNTWNPGDYFQFQVPTTGLAGATHLQITWDHTSSATGPKSFALQYSTDGSSFASLFSYAALENVAVADGPDARSAWASTGARQATYTQTADTSAIPGGLVGQATVYFRVVNTEEAASAASGTSRIDNFAVEAISAVPEPEEYAALFAAALVGFAVWRRAQARHT